MSTRENQPEDFTVPPAEQIEDPIGPMGMPKRSWIGARAFALVGATGVLSIGLVEVTDRCITTTVSAPG
ncbi:hypothetical protein [Streptomyces sp. SID13031]|uniref:hypothetical protein n=1 Tax=Streptomyces sp. SID13031 TaxID=2706046 RepID=UPI0013C9D07D|nr:hypothetical protein [Streptomyces sp. SID13031]NEA34394.1 hypothetical protein [Streptomyces sp. SID13031]